MKDIKDYEGLYAVTEDGQVWSHRSKRFLTSSLRANGYLTVHLCKDGAKKHHYIHRLVAEAYIPNPEGLPQVNHKDENKQNNSLNNLEWCSSQYNHEYGTRTRRTCKPVYCVELNKIFESASEAARQLKADQSCISKACKREGKIAYGYHWQYI